MSSFGDMTEERRTVSRAPPPAGVTPNFENPESCKNDLFVGGSILLAIATICVVARIIARACIVRSVGWDDYLSILANAFVVLCFSAAIQLTKWGYGLHIWDIPDSTDYQGPTMVWNLMVYLAYLGAMGTIKLSALFLYLRIFCVGQKMRFSIYAMLVLVGGSLLGGILSLVFGCRPVEAMYQWDAEGASCIEVPKHVMALSIINILTDFLILILPIPVVWSLHLPNRQKLVILAIFSTGFFVCGVSILRLVRIRQTQGYSSVDYTWDEFEATFWSLVEVTLALMCSCVPALKPLVRAIIPWAQRLSAKASTSGQKLNSSLGSSIRHRKQSWPPPLATSQDAEDARIGNGTYLELGEASTSIHSFAMGAPKSEGHHATGPDSPSRSSPVENSTILKTVCVEIQAQPGDSLPEKFSLFPPQAERDSRWR